MKYGDALSGEIELVGNDLTISLQMSQILIMEGLLLHVCIDDAL